MKMSMEEIIRRYQPRLYRLSDGEIIVAFPNAALIRRDGMTLELARQKAAIVALLQAQGQEPGSFASVIQKQQERKPDAG